MPLPSPSPSPPMSKGTSIASDLFSSAAEPVVSGAPRLRGRGGDECDGGRARALCELRIPARVPGVHALAAAGARVPRCAEVFAAFTFSFSFALRRHLLRLSHHRRRGCYVGSDPLSGNRTYDELDRSNFQAWFNKQNPSHAGLTPRSALEPPSPRAFAQAAAPVGIPPPPPLGAVGSAAARPRPRPPLPTPSPVSAPAPPVCTGVCASNESGADTGAAGAASAFGRAPAVCILCASFAPLPGRALLWARRNKPACVERRIELAAGQCA